MTRERWRGVDGAVAENVTAIGAAPQYVFYVLSLGILDQYQPRDQMLRLSSPSLTPSIVPDFRAGLRDF